MADPRITLDPPVNGLATEWDVIVIGAGAAGLFCAIEAGKRGRRVLVLEHAERVGKKIAISGGGRCNFTNLHTSADNFISANPHFCKSALARFTPADFIALVEKHGIAYHEKTLGQLFCDRSSQQIIDLLLRECLEAGVAIRRRCRVTGVRKDGSFRIDSDHGSFVSSSLVIATGGLSIAPLGATDFGYRIARQFGLSIEETRPGLVPLTLTREMQPASLAGVSLDVTVACSERGGRKRRQFRESMLITHRGLSGPAILQISSYWQPNEPISIDLLPEQDALGFLSARNSVQDAEVELATLLSRYFPRRFAQAWCELFAASKPLKRYNSRELQEIAYKLHNLQLTPSGPEGC